MSLLVDLSSGVYAACSYLADGIAGVKDAALYLAQTNYTVVASVLSFFTCVFDSVRMLVELISYYVGTFVTSVCDCVHAVSLLKDSFVDTCLEMVSAIRSSLLDSFATASSFFNSISFYISESAFSLKMLSLDIYDSISCFVSNITSSSMNVATAISMFMTGMGQFCAGVVMSVWRVLGFVLSSIAYLPVYVFECMEAFKNSMIENVVHAFTTVPKETYLGIICLCLLYFTFSNAARYLSCHGLKIFSMRVRSRRRRPSFDWQYDRDFESDFEDMYGNDVDQNVWMIPGITTTTRPIDIGDDEETINDSSSSDSGTVDENNEVSDDDDEDEDEVDSEDDASEDGITVISDDSDSDTSINSRTVSTGSSEHEIEISLPTVDEGYSLRSRSSTPSSVGSRDLSSPEDFNREMEREKDKRKCVVCQDQIKSVLVLPCRHMCLCVLCADQIVHSRTAARRVCPLCRARIEKVMNVYV